MGIAEGELNALALHLGAVTGTDDLQSLGITLVHALDHARHDGASQAVLCTGRTQVISRGEDNFVAFDHCGDAFRNLVGISALSALGGKGLTVDLDFHASRDGDGELTNMRCHVSALLSHQTKATISPPMPRSRHSFWVSSPELVEMIAMPRPPSGIGRASDFA